MIRYKLTPIHESVDLGTYDVTDFNCEINEMSTNGITSLVLSTLISIVYIAYFDSYEEAEEAFDDISKLYTLGEALDYLDDNHIEYNSLERIKSNH